MDRQEREERRVGSWVPKFGEVERGFGRRFKEVRVRFRSSGEVRKKESSEGPRELEDTSRTLRLERDLRDSNTVVTEQPFKRRRRRFFTDDHVSGVKGTEERSFSDRSRERIFGKG